MAKLEEYNKGSKKLSGVSYFTCVDVNGNVVNIPISEITNISSDASNVQAELDIVEDSIGLNGDGTYTANAGTNYITGATSLDNADILLDAQVKSNKDDIDTLDLEDVRQNDNSIAGDIDFSENNAEDVGEIGFNASHTTPAWAEGRIFYDKDKHSLSGYNESSDVTVNFGEELLAPIVVNKTGSDIHDGMCVYISGVDGTSGYWTVGLADSQYKDKSRRVYVSTSTIINNSIGRVTRIGEVGGFDTSLFTVGETVYLGHSGAITSTVPVDGEYRVQIGQVKTQHATDGIILVDSTTADLTIEVTDTNGFPTDQRTGTTLSVVELTRTFSITPTGSEFHFYERGIKYEKVGAQSIVFDNLEGEHWFYFEDGVLTTLHDPNATERQTIILGNAFIAAVYWDETNGVVVGDIQDERHGISMSPSSHLYNHLTRSAQFVSGYGLGDFTVDASGALDIHAQFSVASGTFVDEDIFHSEAGKAIGDTITVFYNSGASGYLRASTKTGFAALNDGVGGNIYYNEWTGATWQLTPVGNNDYCCYHVFSFNGQDVNVISVMGQETYGNVSAARAGANTEISNIISSLPFPEMIPIGSIVFQANSSYANALKAKIRSVDGNNYVDWRTTELAQGANPTSHLNLTNVEAAGVGVTDGHVDEALYSKIVVGEEVETTTGSGIIDLSDGRTFHRTISTGTSFEIQNEEVCNFKIFMAATGAVSVASTLFTHATKSIVVISKYDTINGSFPLMIDCSILFQDATFIYVAYEIKQQ